MAEQALPSVKRMDELDRWCHLADERAIAVDPDELRALLSAARLVPVLMAECEDWRHRAGKYKTTATDATDTALARAGVKMGGTR